MQRISSVSKGNDSFGFKENSKMWKIFIIQKISSQVMQAKANWKLTGNSLETNYKIL